MTDLEPIHSIADDEQIRALAGLLAEGLLRLECRRGAKSQDTADEADARPVAAEDGVAPLIETHS